MIGAIDAPALHLNEHYSGYYGCTPNSQIPGQAQFKKIRRDQNEGKRWVRRKDNG